MLAENRDFLTDNQSTKAHPTVGDSLWTEPYATAYEPSLMPYVIDSLWNKPYAISHGLIPDQGDNVVGAATGELLCGGTFRDLAAGRLERVDVRWTIAERMARIAVNRTECRDYHLHHSFVHYSPMHETISPCSVRSQQVWPRPLAAAAGTTICRLAALACSVLCCAVPAELLCWLPLRAALAVCRDQTQSDLLTPIAWAMACERFTSVSVPQYLCRSICAATTQQSLSCRQQRRQREQSTNQPRPSPTPSPVLAQPPAPS